MNKAILMGIICISLLGTAYGVISESPEVYKQWHSINHQVNPNQVICGDHFCAFNETFALTLNGDYSADSIRKHINTP